MEICVTQTRLLLPEPIISTAHQINYWLIFLAQSLVDLSDY